MLDAKQTGGQEIERMRAVWAGLQNDALERAEVRKRVDHRALEVQRTSAPRAIDRRGAGITETGGLREAGVDRATLAEIGRMVQAVRHGERAGAEGQRLVAGARMRAGPKMRL